MNLLTKRIKPFLLFTVIICGLAACKKVLNDPFVPEAPLAKSITEFKFEASLNKDFLSETINGEISGDTIKISLPEELNCRTLIASFKYEGRLVSVNDVKQYSGISVNNFEKPLIYSVMADDGSERNFFIQTALIPEVRQAVPHIYIVTDGNTPITSKESYLKADIRIDGKGTFENYEGRTSIKGRGNTTWRGYPKKPYRLKLDTKAPLLGFSPEKDWILLANYLDESLMCNAAAMKIGRLLEMPFTNHIIPVDLTVNGVYLGNYMFTEQKEVEDNRINVGKDGVWLELDMQYDEDFKFRSDHIQLPVMIQYPDLGKLAPTEAGVRLAQIQADFNQLEASLMDASFPNNNYRQYLDIESVANYIIANTLADNREIGWPKSVLLYKTATGKYTFGPIWDFDWGFGFDYGQMKHFVVDERPLIGNNNFGGTRLFSRLMQDPQVKRAITKKWIVFKGSSYPKLVKYLKDYNTAISSSLHNDYQVWKRGSGDAFTELTHMLNWLDRRVEYMDNLIGGWGFMGTP